MHYLYGDFSNTQINEVAKLMHNDIHKLLLYKDPKITEVIFETEDDFFRYYENILFRFGGLNKLLQEPPIFVSLMSTLQSAYDEVKSDNYRYSVFRRAILDCHGYIKSIFEEV